MAWTNAQLEDAGVYSVVVTNEAFYQPGFLSDRVDLPVVKDTAGDGLSDDWETLHGLNPADPSDAGLDGDGDGMSHLKEQIAGTDPGDIGSHFHIESVTADSAPPAAIRVRFRTEAGRTYTLQSAEDPAAGPWRRVADIVATAARQTIELEDQPGSPAAARYYRIVTPRAP